MPSRRFHRRPKPNLDERFNLPEDTNPDDVLRSLLAHRPSSDDDQEETEEREEA